MFNKLHDEGLAKLEKQQRNEEIRKRRETQYCTFKPEVKTEEAGKSRKDVYERLAQSNKQLRVQYYDAEKEAREVQFCTFHPDLPKAANGKKGHATNLSAELGEKVHERLHKEAEVMVQMRQCKQFAKREKELDGCTFKPSINSRRSSSQAATARRFEDLYHDNERKKRQQSKNEVMHDEQERSKYTFRPQLVSKSKPDEAVDDIPRYEKLYTKHSQKQHLLEQKRNELIEEERKMRQFVAQGVKRPAGVRPGNLGSTQLCSARTLGAEPRGSGAAFERLYGMDKVYRENKHSLERKIMKEEGISFSPRTNVGPSVLTDRDNKGVVERNEEFLREKNSKIARQVPTEMKECTFVPLVCRGKEAKGPETHKDFAERLYAYFDVYEKRKAECRQKHGET